MSRCLRGGAWRIVLLAGVASGCSYFRYPPNPVLKDLDPGSAYRFTAVVPPETGAPEDETLVILTLSGGGTRAAALSYGVMREMDRAMIGGGTTSLLDEVDVISSVSGGASPPGTMGCSAKTSSWAIKEFTTRRMFSGQVGEIFAMPTGRHRLFADTILFVGRGTFDAFGSTNGNAGAEVQRFVAENIMHGRDRVGPYQPLEIVREFAKSRAEIRPIGGFLAPEWRC